MTALVVHPTSLALLSFPPLSLSRIEPSKTPLALPSRFPSTSPSNSSSTSSSASTQSAATPLAVVSPLTGHIFLYAPRGTVVWEYDHRGRRVGEISVGAAGGADAVVPFAGGVVVVSGRQEECEIGVFRRSGEVGKKWVLERRFEGPPGHVSAVAAEGNLVVICADEVVAFDLATGAHHTVGGIDRPVMCAKILSDPPTLLIPNKSGIAAISLGGLEGVGGPGDKNADSLREVPLSIGRVRDIALGPTTAAGQRVAMLSEGPRGVVVVAPREHLGREYQKITFGQEIASIAFLDNHTLAARTAAGKLFVADIALATPRAVEATVGEVVLGLDGVPSRHTRSSSVRTASGMPLSERSVNTPMSVPNRFPDLGGGGGGGGVGVAIAKEGRSGEEKARVASAPVRHEPERHERHERNEHQRDQRHQPEERNEQERHARHESELDDEDRDRDMEQVENRGSGSASGSGSGSTSGSGAGPASRPNTHTHQPKAHASHSGPIDRERPGPVPVPVTVPVSAPSRPARRGSPAKAESDAGSARSGLSGQSGQSGESGSGQSEAPRARGQPGSGQSETPRAVRARAGSDISSPRSAVSTSAIPSVPTVPPSSSTISSQPTFTPASSQPTQPTQLTQLTSTSTSASGASLSAQPSHCPTCHLHTPHTPTQSQTHEYTALRNDIANLQLDMLRMSRNLKNEIRAAVAPLVEEIRAGREVIARQEAEIGRLRRGY